MNPREVRYLQTTEVRAAGGSGDADPLRLEGHAAVFNVPAKLPGFREKILPGAFTRAINDKQDVVCLWNHNADVVLGRTTSGTLRLNQDSRGLHYVCDLPNTQAARDNHESIRRGDVNGCSFGFIVAQDGQEWSEQRDDDGTFYVLREIRDVKLLDVSPVTYPCYDGTDVSARTIDVPVELRAQVDAKNQAAAAMIVPPAIEKRPYNSVDEVPDSVPKAKRKQWMEVWNSAYHAALKKGMSAKDAEGSAFAQANGVVKESKAMDIFKEFRAITGINGDTVSPQDCPASWSAELKTAYCDGYNAAFEKARAAGKKGNVAIALAVAGGMMGIHEMLNRDDQSGSEQPPAQQADTDLDDDTKAAGKGRSTQAGERRAVESFEDQLCDIGKALCKQFPNDPNDTAVSCFNCKYQIMETYNDHVICSEAGPNGGYVSLPYSKDADGNITFGAPVPVEKEWVPSDRAKLQLAELRKDDMEDDDDGGDDDDDTDLDLEGFDMFYLGRSHDAATLAAGHVDDGNCLVGNCTCQNRFCPTGSARRNAIRGVEFKMIAELDKFKRFDELPEEYRAGMTRTKRVAGKDLSAKSFAYVGDPNDTTTWKFPIFDASHVRNALARWGQDKGIPADKQAGVYAKIKAAAKKFGVEVSEPDASKARSDEMSKELRERIAEHMLHVGPDFSIDLRDMAQPRGDAGKFGTTDGARAASADEHTAAAKAHFAQAVEAKKKGQKPAARAHKAAAQAHTDAAAAKANNETGAMEKTDLAQAHSKVANAASKRYESMVD